MREIKFRAWDGSRMYYFENHEWTLDYNDISGWNVVKNLPPDQLKGRKWDAGESSNTAEHFQLMQFTGLLDKNGKEIFEGDLMRFFDKTVAVIVFESFGGWCFKWIDQTYKNVRQQNPEPIFRNINLFEVVGNIHENPELL